MGKFKTNQFAISLLVLSLIFIFNIVGLYQEGFIYKYYLVAEIEHLLGGLFGAMLFASFYATRKLILISVLIVGLLWESLEFFIVYYPLALEFIKQTLRIGDFGIIWWDVCLDIVIDLTGGYLYLVMKTNKKEA